MNNIARYFVPILMVLIGIKVYLGNPNDPIQSNIPIIPGGMKPEISLFFFTIGFITFMLLKFKK